MKNLGRAPYKEIKLLNGFYIEVRNKGSKDRGIKIRSADKATMKEAGKSTAEIGAVLRAVRALRMTLDLVPLPPDPIDLGELLDG